MKRKIIAFAFILFVTASAFAADDANNVNSKIVRSFTSNFNNAKNVKWKIADSYVKVNFEFNGQSKVAIYNFDGDLLATSVKFNFNNLPQNALETLAKKYPFPPYKLKDCVELIDEDQQKNYFVSFESEKENVVLKIGLTGEVTVFSKTRN